MSAIRETGREGTMRAILDYLAAKRIRAFRMQVGCAKIDGRFVRFGVEGMADILAFPQVLISTGECIPAVLWIECKSPKGKGQSAMQKSFMDDVREHGHSYAVCRSIKDVDAALAEVQRRW